MEAAQLLIAGLERTSLIEYPGELSAVVFLQGCNFRCPYCHNPWLVRGEMGTEPFSPECSGANVVHGGKRAPSPFHPTVPTGELARLLDRRRRVLDAVTVTGGEPTVYPQLPEFLAWIRSFGYRVKLDTNGTRPTLLRQVIDDGLVDYVAMDIKSSAARYAEAAGCPVDMEAVEESMGLVMQSGVGYEFRSTILPRLHSLATVDAMAQLIRGAERYYLQTFRPLETLDPAYRHEPPFTPDQMLMLAAIAAQHVRRCEVR